MNTANRGRKGEESPLFCFSLGRLQSPPFVLYWSGDREAEGVRLESVCTLTGYRGFESLPLRLFPRV